MIGILLLDISYVTERPNRMQRLPLKTKENFVCRMLLSGPTKREKDSTKFDNYKKTKVQRSFRLFILF